MNTSQKAPLLVDGVHLPGGVASITSSDTAVALPINVSLPEGVFAYISGQGVGDATITVIKDGRTGSVLVSVTDAPLVVTLGTPEPK